MKRTILGIAVMILGAVMCITGTTLCAVSAQTNDNSVEDDLKAIVNVQENKVYSGIYVSLNNGGEQVTITDDVIIFSDGSEEDYRLSVWKNMPDTNEETGKITYSDYCFLKTSRNNFRYYPNTKEIDINGIVYSLNSL
ncbi:MAG: hypothetical protein HDT44_02860 [Ruminococcaceae bacterium]|nr:hypothetical protein [Oscillospiraceae bacterium]